MSSWFKLFFVLVLFTSSQALWVPWGYSYSDAPPPGSTSEVPVFEDTEEIEDLEDEVELPESEPQKKRKKKDRNSQQSLRSTTEIRLAKKADSEEDIRISPAPDIEVPQASPMRNIGAEDDSTAFSEEEWNEDLLPVDLARPRWGVQLNVSLAALEGLSVERGSASISSYQLELSYQPPVLGSLGVLSLGPTLAIYPTSPENELTSTAFSIWSLGAAARLQLHLWERPFLVPILGYSAESLGFRFSSTGNKGRFFYTGPTFGLMFLLNVVEPNQAGEFYVNEGIARSYLFGEMRQLTGSGNGVKIDGTSVHFGLRLEY